MPWSCGLARFTGLLHTGEGIRARNASIERGLADASCAVSGCHAGEDPAGGLNLSEGLAYDNIVNVALSEVPDLMLVERGNAQDSYLYIKITGGDRIAPETLPMPIGRELTGDQIALVEDWIDGGADR